MDRLRSARASTFAILLGCLGYASAPWAAESWAADGAPLEHAGEAAAPLSGSDLEELVGPVALYPDDLLAIVLPAATFPLQIVQAERYLAALEGDPDLDPDEGWDESVIALLNYPDVITKMNQDLDWTWELGQAVRNQRSSVLDAVERFRERAIAAGNLSSDERQTVVDKNGDITIRQADPEVIYVPYYEPSYVVVRQAAPVYHYYDRPYPVYYYPYPSGHYLTSSYFWGVTSAFSIAWASHDLVYHRHNHYGHPYYGRRYAFNDYRYWRPRQHYYDRVGRAPIGRRRGEPDHYRKLPDGPRADRRRDERRDQRPVYTTRMAGVDRRLERDPRSAARIESKPRAGSIQTRTERPKTRAPARAPERRAAPRQAPRQPAAVAQPRTAPRAAGDALAHARSAARAPARAAPAPRPAREPRAPQARSPQPPPQARAAQPPPRVERGARDVSRNPRGRHDPR